MILIQETMTSNVEFVIADYIDKNIYYLTQKQMITPSLHQNCKDIWRDRSGQARDLGPGHVLNS
jgi:hypothetical protein